MRGWSIRMTKVCGLSVWPRIDGKEYQLTSHSTILGNHKNTYIHTSSKHSHVSEHFQYSINYTSIVEQGQAKTKVLMATLSPPKTKKKLLIFFVFDDFKPTCLALKSAMTWL